MCNNRHFRSFLRMHFCIAAAQMPGQASQHTACDACRKNLISGFLFSAELPAWRQGAVVIHRIPAQEVAGVLLHVNFKQVPNTFCKYLSTRAHLCHVSFGACTGVDSGALGARLQGPALNSHEHPELEYRGQISGKTKARAWGTRCSVACCSTCWRTHYWQARPSVPAWLNIRIRCCR